MNQDKKTRIVLIRHGEPLQHSGRIFLGQADIVLSEKGKQEAKTAAEKLIEINVETETIYTSDLLRAKETADIISKINNNVSVKEDKLFREMDLGLWDGELIEEIKEKFPEAYEKRGADILNYRIPGGENFFDLKTRVTKEFWRLFTGEFADSCSRGKSKDFVLVAHLGVISSLVSEITLDDESAFGRGSYPTGSVTVIDAPDWMEDKI